MRRAPLLSSFTFGYFNNLFLVSLNKIKIKFKKENI